MNDLRLSLCAVLIALLLFSALSALAAAQEQFDTEYASAQWETSVSKESVSAGEEFYAMLDLVSTIKKIPEEHKDLVNLANRVSAEITVYYDVIATHQDSGEWTKLRSDTITEPLPHIGEGATLEFHERIPSDGWLSFTADMQGGDYTLGIKICSVKAKFLFITRDVTDMIRPYLPPQAFDPGIKLSGIELAEKLPGDINGDGKIEASDLAGVAGAFNSQRGKPNWNSAADLNQDGIVDILDLVVVGENFGEKID